MCVSVHACMCVYMYVYACMRVCVCVSVSASTYSSSGVLCCCHYLQKLDYWFYFFLPLPTHQQIVIHVKCIYTVHEKPVVLSKLFAINITQYSRTLSICTFNDIVMKITRKISSIQEFVAL